MISTKMAISFLTLALFTFTNTIAATAAHLGTDGKKIAHDPASISLIRGQTVNFGELAGTVPQGHNLPILPKNRGWSGVEPTHVWLEGRSGSFVFHVPQYKSRRCSLRITGGGFAVKGHKTVNATMQLGNGKIQRIRLRHPDKGSYKTTLRFDASMYQGQDIEVLIRVDSTMTPRELGINRDGRQLGLNIWAVKLSGC